MISKFFKLLKRLINKLTQEKNLNFNRVNNLIYINKIRTNRIFNTYKVYIVVNLFIQDSYSKRRDK